MSTMFRSRSRAARRSALLGTLGLAATTVMLVGCTQPTTGGGGSSGDPVAAADCGVLPGSTPNDPDGVVPQLPADAQVGFADFPYTVQASAWADSEPRTGPFSIGYSSLPLINAWGSDSYDYMTERVAELGDAGITDPELTNGILPDPATMTPAEQIALYQQMVDQGVDGIIIIPLSGEAMADVVTAAGEKGVVTVAANGNIPSPYAINVQLNPFLQGLQPAAEALKHFGGEAKVLYVGGIPGETTEQVTYEGFQAMLQNCPDVEVVGEVYGQYSSAGAKAAVLQFLASYPGDIDMVVTPGTMGPGIISGFIDAGRTVPMVTATGAQAGEVAYWVDQLDENPDFVNFGTGGTSPEVAEAALQVLIKTLLGGHPIANTVSTEPSYITNDNVAQFAVPGADLNSPDQIKPSPDLLSVDYVDLFFQDPQPIE